MTKVTLEKYHDRLMPYVDGSVTHTCYSVHSDKFKMKAVTKIVLITKQECMELQKLGHKFGSEGALHHSYTKHHKYYLTESKKAMADLDRIRKSHIVER